MSDSERYDRQIRLWGPHGQAAISNASLYVCGSDGCATEFLKTMVLHGVKDVTIVDDAIVTEEDLMTNFFTDGESVGKPRAEVAARLLTELNPFAKVVPIIANPDSLPEFDKLGLHSYVLTTGNKTAESLGALNAKCRAKGIKQVHFQSTGFFGAFYVDAGLHHLLEGATSSLYPNELRILNPFEELKQFWESFDFDSLDDKQHSHLPYTVVLYRARKLLMAELGVEKLTYQHRMPLIQKVDELRRRKPDAGPDEYPYLEEEGFDEAVENIALGYGTAFPPPETVDCFRVLEENVPEDTKERFWRLVRGAHHFYQKHGVLPHYGDCPDMECLPEYFRQQKAIYVARSKADWEEIMAEVGGDIDPEYVARFAHNVWRIGGVVFKSIVETLNQKPGEHWDDSSRTQFNQTSCVQLLFIAARNFLQKNGRNPQNNEGDRKEILDDILAMGADATEAPKFAEEFCRYNGTMLPSVVASLAAILAEEVTKLIIEQATPMKGLVVYDAIHGLLDAPE